MAKSRKLETLLAQLEQVQNDPTQPGAIDLLRQALNSKYGVAVAQAARIVGRAELGELVPELVQAFDRCLVDPVQTDPNCLAKDSIVDALYRLGRSEERVFLTGIRHVQREPVFGGRVDTAAKLRGTCALGLVRMAYPDLLVELADLLADPEPQARIGAARALAYGEHSLSIPLLRLRARLEERPDVLAEYCAALLQLSPGGCLAFVAGFLRSPQPDIQELTALVLGESRLPQALEPLSQWWQRTVDANLRRTALVAIALLRSEAAFQFLLDLIQTGGEDQAKGAIAALTPYRQDPFLDQQLRHRVEQRGTLNWLDS